MDNILDYDEKEDGKNRYYNLTLECIKTADKCYLRVKTEYSSESLSGYLFDGNTPKETFKKGWYEIDSMPREILYPCSSPKNIRYELKEEYVEMPLPKIISEIGWKDYESDMMKYRNLYEYKCDIEKAFKRVKFEVEIIGEINSFDQLSVDPEHKVEYPLLSQIMFHKDLLPVHQCKIKSKEAFNIVYKYLSLNLDKNIGRLQTDDYLWGIKYFNVIKYVKLIEPIKQMKQYYAKRNSKKPSYIEVTKYQDEFEISSFGY